MTASAMPSVQRTAMSSTIACENPVGSNAVSTLQTAQMRTPPVSTRRGPKRTASTPAGIWKAA